MRRGSATVGLQIGREVEHGRARQELQVQPLDRAHRLEVGVIQSLHVARSRRDHQHAQLVDPLRLPGGHWPRVIEASTERAAASPKQEIVVVAQELPGHGAHEGIVGVETQLNWQVRPDDLQGVLEDLARLLIVG